MIDRHSSGLGCFQYAFPISEDLASCCHFNFNVCVRPRCSWRFQRYKRSYVSVYSKCGQPTACTKARSPKSKFESREDIIDSRLLAKTAAVHKLVEEPP